MDNIAAGGGNGLRGYGLMDKRKPNRLEYYDYSQNGAYFITICTRDKRGILCDVVGDGALDVPQIHLSDYGKIVNDEIIKSNEIYDYINIDKYVIMPNHIHLILIIDRDNKGTSRAPSRTNAIIPLFVSMLKRFTNKKCGISLWQRSFHDHVIRNECDYRRIWEYIDTNPAKWELDCYYIQ